MFLDAVSVQAHEPTHLTYWKYICILEVSPIRMCIQGENFCHYLAFKLVETYLFDPTIAHHTPTYGMRNGTHAK